MDFISHIIYCAKILIYVGTTGGCLIKLLDQAAKI